MSDRKLETLLLSEDDVIAAGGLDMKKCVATMEDVFRVYATGDWRMCGGEGVAHGGVVTFPDNPPVPTMPKNTPDRRYVAMCGYLGGRFRACGGKFYGSNRENLKNGMPRSILTAFLSDTDTGAPLAIMQGCILSTMRTGAMPGVANKYLQASTAQTVGIVGAGVISHACCLSLIETMPSCREVFIYDIVEERSEKFAKEMEADTGIKMTVVHSMEELVRNSDAISLASSGANPAYIKTEWLRPGATILITGGGLVDDELLEDPDTGIVIDCVGMHKDNMLSATENGVIQEFAKQWSSYQYFKLVEAGKISEKAVELGDVVGGKVNLRKNDTHHNVFLSSGLSLEDVGWIYEVYQTALEKGIGTWFKFWDEPHWV